jgi:hypothetical protein
MKNEYKAAIKRCERARDHVEKITPSKKPVSPETPTMLSPRTRTTAELRTQGITPSKIPRKIVQKLVLANAFTDEIKTAKKANDTRGNRVIKQIISGDVIRKSKLKRALGRSVGCDRHTLKSTDKMSEAPKRRRLLQRQLENQRKVKEFLLRDDNSREMPGKTDFKKVNGEQKQKRVLNDSLKNLCLKFKSENPDVKMSFTTFSRMRPTYISLTQYISRNQCLCQKHQNFALLLKAAKSVGADVSLNPEDYTKDITPANANELVSKVNRDVVTYEQWKSVDCDDGKKRMKVVQTTCCKEEFADLFVKQISAFQEHANRIKAQYKAISDLKKQLPENHVIVQMDFSENYSCVAADEIQSAFWNQNAITLHPVVVYYSDGDILLHKSYVYASDDLGHNAGTVFAFLQKLMPQIQADIGRDAIEHVHYWTDSPCSQYRNISIFKVVSDHIKLFGVSATWNYFESGHGKGPCDGLGGSAKRMADLAVRQNKCRIGNAEDFVQWGITHQANVTYILVETEAINNARRKLQAMCKGSVPVKGTMKLHAVTSATTGKILTRATSCYCNGCLSGKHHDHDWAVAELGQNCPVEDSVAVAVIEICPRVLRKRSS